MLLPFDSAWAEENFILPYGNSLGGIVWQPPTNSQIIPFVYYNKAIFEEVGVEPPATWDEFLAVAQAIKDAGHVPIAMCGGELWCGSFPMIGIITADVVGDNPDWVLQRYTGEVSFSDPDFVAAVEKYKELVDKGYIDEGALGMDYASTNQQFLDGDAAMYFMGSWLIASIPEDHPFEVGAFLVPRNDGKVVIPFNVGEGVHVSALTEHPEEAMMYAQAWALAPANLLALIEGDAAFPMLKGLTIEDYGADVSDLFMEGYDYVLDEDGFKAESFTWTTNDYSLLPGMNDELWKSYQSIFLGAGVEDEMKRLDDLWDEIAERSER
ncbi:MAG: extracellular solute-binding protein [Anaerolineales bacterium]|nr:extracellular solute-binding protein [Anaerolineales bacterium]